MKDGWSWFTVVCWIIVIAMIIGAIYEVHAIITADIPLWMKIALL